MFLVLAHKVVKEMMAMFSALDSEYHPPIENPELDTEGYCKTVVGQRGFLGPWADLRGGSSALKSDDSVEVRPDRVIIR